MTRVDSSTLDTVVGCISGLKFDQISAWAGSLKASGFSGRKVVIHVRVDAETIAELHRLGFETFDASVLHQGGDGFLKKNPAADEISVDRFYYIWHFLNHSPSYCRYLIATDTTDVVFQRNPSRWLEEHLGHKRLVAGCESLPYEYEPWGAQTMQECYGPHVWESQRHRLIYNAGSIAGEFRTMIDLCLQVYFLAPGDRVLYSDQQALNLLLSSAVYQEVTRFADSEEGWVCQAGTTAEPDLLAQVRPHLTAPLPTFDGEYVRTASGEIFTLVHQYNRVPDWDMPLKNKYALKN